jgi:small nuclear ribonucleoprotein (snRNP)-like protein
MDNKKIKGKLYAFDDNQLMLTTSSNESYAISAANIRTISFKEKNAVLKGSLIGFTVGALSGIGCQRLVNLHYSDPPGKNNVKAGLLFGSAVGLAGGLSAAVFKKTFMIRGKKARYYKLHPNLIKRLN